MAPWPGPSSARAFKPHIGVLLPNGPEYLFWLDAAALAGAAMVGINPTRAWALAADVWATDCSVIVTDAEGAELLHGLDTGVPHHSPGHKHRPVRGGARGGSPRGRPPGAHRNAGALDEESSSC